ncbi:MAG TPA: methyl-accepting chemotaxis protein [Clostridia bacterium]|nr:methyl-accepting chemotaxis protein [Clostridia bacterium]
MISLRPKRVLERKNFRVNYKEFLSTKSLLPRMALMFLLLIVLPVTIISVIAVIYASNALTSQAKHNVVNSVKQSSLYFDTIISRTKDLSTELMDSSVSDMIKCYITKGKTSPEYIEKSRDVQKRLSTISISNNYVSGIYIILDDNANVYSGSEPEINGPDMKNAGWYKQIKAAKGKDVWIDNHDTGISVKGKYSVSVGRNMNKLVYDSSHINTLMIDISYDVFSNVLIDTHIGKNDSTYLITPSGKVISKNADKDTNEVQNYAYFKDVKKRAEKVNTGIFTFKDDKNNTYMIGYFKSKETGWISTLIMPMDEITAPIAKIINTIIVFGVLFALAAVIIGAMFSYSIARSMNEVTHIMKMAADGDFTVELKNNRKDEIGYVADSFNMMLTEIKDLITQSKQLVSKVDESAGQMKALSKDTAHISSEVSKAIEQVATGASNQAMDVEQGLIAVQNLTGIIESVVSGTEVIENTSGEVKELTGSGLASMQLLKAKTAETNEITNNVVVEMGKLNNNVKSINNIADILKSIADQTNLLSLNALIEAARAGEHGKGFAVVAEEVRKLAEQSEMATKEIQRLINSIFKQTETATVLVYKAEAAVDEQNITVQESTEIFTRITSSTNVLLDNINNIFLSAKNLDENKNDVLDRISSISVISEETAASSEEVSASTQTQLASVDELTGLSEQLSEVSLSLTRTMSVFKV